MSGKMNKREQKENDKEDIRPVTRKGVSELISALTGDIRSNLSQVKEKGLVNQIYTANTKKWGPIVIRARENPRALIEYEKEKWCVEKAAKHGVRVPKVLAIGKEPFYYSVHTRLPGKTADEYQFGGNSLYVWRQIGECARLINSIPTKGFGKQFQWRTGRGKKFSNWASYINKRIKEKIDQEALISNNIIDKKILKKVLNRLEELKDWRVDKTTLAHGGLAFKNTMVDKKGKVTGIIDWDSAASAPNPQYEFAHNFFWMTSDEINVFLKGYGISQNKYKNIQRDVYTLMLLRGLRTALWYVGRKELDQVERTKEKLKPALESL